MNFNKWEKIAEQELINKKLYKLIKKSEEDINIYPIYTYENIKNIKKNEYSGCPPYKRGHKATMYANKPWTIRQYGGFATAKETNMFYRKNLQSGQTGISIAFDLPTHRGYDSDNNNISEDVGKTGVAIDSIEDMKQLLKNIPLDKTSISMTISGAVLPILATLIVTAEENGVNKKFIKGTIQNDILKEFLVRNTFIYPPKQSMRIAIDTIEYISKEMPLFNSISISGYHIHEAGANLALELGLTLSNGIEYVQQALNRGLKIDQFAPRISFFFALGMNFYMEIAKLRAARILWHNLIKKFSPNNPKSKMLRTHCQTSGWSLQAKDPYNNIIRTTIEAMAGIFGGTQSLHTNSFDEALALPSDFAAKIARNTQLILQYETGICQTVDPFGGSYLIEALTEKMIIQTLKIINKIDNLGGMTQAIINGIPKQWIEESATKNQTLIENGDKIIIGLNKYQSTETHHIPLKIIHNNNIILEQIKNIKNIKNKRNNIKVKQCLYELLQGAKTNHNLLYLTINAIRARATIGEISLILENVFHRYNMTYKLNTNIYKKYYNNEQEFKNFLKKINIFTNTRGKKPRILLTKIGQDGHDRGMHFIASALADLGFNIDINPLFQTPEYIAKNAIENDVDIIGISSLTATHITLIPQLINILKQRNANDILIILGGIIPIIDHKKLLNQGVSAIFTPDTKTLTIAKQLLKLLT